MYLRQVTRQYQFSLTPERLRPILYQIYIYEFLSGASNSEECNQATKLNFHIICLVWLNTNSDVFCSRSLDKRGEAKSFDFCNLFCVHITSQCRCKYIELALHVKLTLH